MALVRSIIRSVFPLHAYARHVAGLLTFVCLLVGLPLLLAQQPLSPGWEWQNPRPQGTTINAVRFAADKKHGWAVGSEGAILRTRNGGFACDSQLSPPKTTLRRLYVKDLSRVVISVACR